jgi:hypothetical protein
MHLYVLLLLMRLCGLVHVSDHAESLPEFVALVVAVIPGDEDVLRATPHDRSLELDGRLHLLLRAGEDGLNGRHWGPERVGLCAWGSWGHRGLGPRVLGLRGKLRGELHMGGRVGGLRPGEVDDLVDLVDLVNVAWLGGDDSGRRRRTGGRFTRSGLVVVRVGVFHGHEPKSEGGGTGLTVGSKAEWTMWLAVCYGHGVSVMGHTTGC